jgi:hypothetical protein
VDTLVKRLFLILFLVLKVMFADRWTLVGVVSYGEKCTTDTHAGVYARHSNVIFNMFLGFFHEF